MENEENFDFADNDLMAFKPDKLSFIMNRIRGLSDFLASCELEYLEEKYNHYYPPVDGEYYISVDHINKFIDYLVSDTLKELTDKGLVDVLWSEEHNDFVFSAK